MLLSMKETFIKYARYSPIVSSIDSLIRAASLPGANVTVAFTAERVIVGFAILQYPSESERWHRVGSRIMMEASVVEVSWAWRVVDPILKVWSMERDYIHTYPAGIWGPRESNRLFEREDQRWRNDLMEEDTED